MPPTVSGDGEILDANAFQQPATKSPSLAVPQEDIHDETDDEPPELEQYGSDSSDDSRPPPALQKREETSSDSSGSSDRADYLYSSDEDSDDEYGKPIPNGELPAYNNAAKSHTKIRAPAKMTRGRLRKKEEYRRFFPGINEENFSRTFDATTQYGTKGAKAGITLQNQILSPNPVLNIPRRQENVSTDTIYSSTPAIFNGATAAQLFTGRTSKYQTIRDIGNSDGDFEKVLMDEIRSLGAMTTLLSDRAKAEISERVKSILRMLVIKDKQSEPHQQRQNFQERTWQNTKSMINNLLNISGAPPELWLEAGRYVCYLRNHIALKSLGWRTPSEWLLGYTPDISVLLQFEFYEPVFIKKLDEKFPEDSTEVLGRFVGIAENVGHAMTYRILLKSGVIVSRAVVRTAMKPGMFNNRRAKEEAEKSAPESNDGETPMVETVAESDDDGSPDGELPTAGNVEHSDDDDSEAKEFTKGIQRDVLRSVHEDDTLWGDKLPEIDIKGLLNRTFITNPDGEGEQHRAKIVEATPTGKVTADGKQQLYLFRCKHGEKLFHEIVAYNKMVEWCERDADKDDMYKFDDIVGHRKRRKRTTKSAWEVLVKWASGKQSWECLSMIYGSDPVTVSMYALRNGLVSTDGWKRCKSHTKNAKKFARMVHQAKLKSYRNQPKYTYGVQIPRDHEEAVLIDEKNGNRLWQDSEDLEIAQLKEYDTFRSIGKGASVPEGYQRIPCHMVYTCKYDGRRKSRFVGGGHRTSTPVDSTYSGVVSLQGIRLCTFLAELNDMPVWGTDIGNAYLESYTTEKVCFTAGGEFGDLEGHTLIIVKALYGLKSSGKCWHDKLFDVLTSMGFKPSKAEADIWMKDCGDHYEYIACYVDDLLIVSRKPEGIIKDLQANPHNFKLKGTGQVSFHLGCDFFRDEEGVMCVGPKTYIEQMGLQYVDLFGEAPKQKYSSPVEKNDHPELDVSPLLPTEGIVKYQSLIGALQWIITLGRFDISVAIMSLSSYRVAPRVGHLDRLKRIVGYLTKMKHGYIRIRTDEPDYSMIPPSSYDWAHTVYGGVTEEVPRDAPTPKGKRVVLTSYVDANLYHDWVNGRAVTAVLHFINQTPFEWFAKKQPSCETATYGSEFMAAKTAVQQIMGIRTSLRYLGVPIHGCTRLFGDNGSVVTSGSVPHSPLKKRWYSLSYHYTREAIASGAVDFRFVPGHLNPSDILSKHWGYAQVWPLLQTCLFWQGDTAKLLLQSDKKTLDDGKGSDKVPDR